jgi:hypothetical protein
VTDDLDKRGQALLDLAQVLASSGDSMAASAAAREALHLFQGKGSVVKAREARESVATASRAP